MIGAGVAYTLGGLVVVAVWLVWLRHGHAVSARFVDHMYGKAQAAPARLRWTYLGWSSPRIADPTERGRLALRAWLPVTLFAPALALGLFVSAVAEFRR